MFFLSNNESFYYDQIMHKHEWLTFRCPLWLSKIKEARKKNCNAQERWLLWMLAMHAIVYKYLRPTHLSLEPFFVVVETISRTSIQYLLVLRKRYNICSLLLVNNSTWDIKWIYVYLYIPNISLHGLHEDIHHICRP